MDMIERLQIRTGEQDDRILQDCLDTATSAIMARRYPFGDWPTESDGTIKVEERYEDLQFRIALDLYNRIGAEGQMSHNENGISRSWGAEWVSNQLLAEVTPKVGVTK